MEEETLNWVGRTRSTLVLSKMAMLPLLGPEVLLECGKPIRRGPVWHIHTDLGVKAKGPIVLSMAKLEEK